MNLHQRCSKRPSADIGAFILCAQAPDLGEQDQDLESFAASVVKRAAGGRIDILAIGPATNIPKLAMLIGPANIERITLMSGVIFDRGNVSQVAEFNAFCDPDALSDTLHIGIPITLVPLDLCRKVLLTVPDIRTIGERAGRAGPALIQAHSQELESYWRQDGIEGCIPHDSVALLVALYPSRFEFINAKILVRLDADNRGETLCQDLYGPTRIAMGGDLKWVRDTIFRDSFS